MLLIRPDNWPGPVPISLLSGNRAVHIWTDASVYALSKAGVPTAVLNRDDYVRYMKLFPGPDGLPTHTIPSSVDVANPVRTL